jgi:farnesyl-diphosphate farnesyltransferase
MDLDALLQGTSRTFAAAIPLLDGSLRDEVAVAYLLFRIADTLEDASEWSKEQRVAALASFEAMLKSGEGAAPRLPPGFDAAHAVLFAAAPEILARMASFGPARADAIRRHATRTAEGMREFVLASNEGSVELASIEELERYCYVVAGIVGELLTDLFALESESIARGRAELDRDAAAFGEALQLVNILKDEMTDAREGRRFLPRAVPVPAVLARATNDCERASAYVAALERLGAPPGVIAFTRFPLRVARETLDALEQKGPGAKIGRARVEALLEEERRAKCAPAHS